MSTKERGIFICFEGSDGVGKTTTIELLSKMMLESFGKSPFVTRQPGGTPLGVKLREILLDKDSFDISEDAKLLLFLADRAQHRSTIEEYLDSGISVIIDRYSPSTIVYQGASLGADFCKRMDDEIGAEKMKPDIYIFLKASPYEIEKRLTKRGIDIDSIKSIERRQMDYIKVLDSYFPDYETINTTTKEAGEVALEALNIIKEKMSRLGLTAISN